MESKVLPELILPGPWTVLDGKPRVRIEKRTLWLEKDNPQSIVAHELAHIAHSPPNLPHDLYVDALEDCRINLWLRHTLKIEPYGIPNHPELIPRMLKSGHVKEAVLVFLSTAPKHYIGLFPPKLDAWVRKLVLACEKLLIPEDGNPPPFLRVTQLADILRAELEPKIEEFLRKEAGGSIVEKEGGLLGDIMEASGTMDILDPPKTVQCLKSSIARARTEGIIPVRMDRYAIDGAVFAPRKRSYRTGTVLIDKSGSMRLTEKQLENIIQGIPLGTVAYYSAREANKGTLVIAGRKGKRIRKIINTGSGNIIDAPVIEWLASQAKPRHYVGDCQFTGKDDMLFSYENLSALSKRLQSIATIHDTSESLLESLAE